MKTEFYGKIEIIKCEKTTIDIYKLKLVDSNYNIIHLYLDRMELNILSKVIFEQLN